MRTWKQAMMLVLGTSTAMATLNAAQAQDLAAARAGIEEIVVTATGRSRASSSTKTDTPIIETPQSISIISREEMDVRAVHTVADALSYSAGVQAESAGIDSRVDEVSVRGFGAGGFSSNNNFIDGLRLPSGGMWTRTSFDPFGLQQIEVLKGPSSVLYGQVAPGGIVNMVSKRPTATPRGEMMLQGAGFTDLGRWQLQAAGDIGGPLNDSGTVLYRFVGLARDGKTQIDKTSNSRHYVSPSATFEIGERLSWTLLGQYQRDEGGSTYQFLPLTGTLNPSNGRHIEIDAYLGEPDWNVFDRDQYLAGSFVEFRLNDSMTLRNNFRYSHISSVYRVTVLAGDTVINCGALVGCIPGQTINRRAVQGAGETDGIAVDTQFELRFATGAVEHTALLGVDHFSTQWEHYRDGVAPARVLPLLDFYNPVPRGAADYAANLSPQIYTETDSKQSGIYGQNQMSVGDLRLTFGGRYDWAKDEAFNPVNRVTTITDADSFTWRAGAVYLFDSGLAPYASYSESFLPSTGTFFDGRPFAPTSGQQYEAGLRYQPPGSNIFITFGAYQITQQNITTPDPDPTHNCGTAPCQVQTGEGRLRGLELEGRASLTSGLSIIGSATKTSSEVTRTNTPVQLGKRLAQVPESMASLFLDYRVQEGNLRGLGLGGGARYTGESYGEVTNTYRMPGYTLVDLFARYDLSALGDQFDGVTISLNARNLADKRFVAWCSSPASCFYGSGRTVTARLQYRW